MVDLMIRDMAQAERPRERLLKVGVEGLRNEELLALVLRTGYRGRSALDVARDVLMEHSTSGLLAMPVHQLTRLRGFGMSRAAALLAGAELAHRAQASEGTADATPTIRHMNDIAALALEIRDKKKEYLMAFFLNARHQLIAKEIISIGTLTASLAHPREIFAPAIGKAAAELILVHNHPSGDPSPSDEDVRLTQRIRQAGQILGIDLLDHVIIAQNGSYSFKMGGRL